MTTKVLAEKVQKTIKGYPVNLKTLQKEGLFLYKCALIKTPRFPTAFKQFFSKNKEKASSHKANPVSFDWNQEAKHAHAVGQFDMPPPESKDEGDHLIPKKIKRWKITEHHIIVRKIRSLEKARASGKKYQVTLLSGLEEEQFSMKEREGLWQQWQEAKPERQFNIGRITNYFS